MTVSRSTHVSANGPVFFLFMAKLKKKKKKKRTSLVAQLVKQCGRPGFDPWVGKIPWRREQLHTPGFWPGEFHRVTKSRT